MRIRTGHGPDDWTLNVPAEPLAPRRINGGLVVGEHGQVEKNRSNKRRHDRKLADAA